MPSRWPRACWPTLPDQGRAAVEAYARAKAYAPDDDEGKMIEIVSRARGDDVISRLFARFSIPKASRKPAAVALAAVPCRGDRAVVGHQQHHVEALGAAQRIDRLAAGSARSGLRH